jgi:hypothetical protein
MTVPQHRSFRRLMISLVAAGLMTFSLPVSPAHSAEIVAECGHEIGDPITVMLRGEIARGDASTLRDQLNRCLLAYDAEAIRRQADSARGHDARKTRAALDARADAIEDQKLILGKPAIRLYLDSPGGDPAEAMAIGRLARQQRLATVVDVNRQCSDACLLAFVGGVVRKTSWDADIVLRRNWESNPGSFVEIDAYATAMGVPKQTLDRLHDGSPHRLTKVEAFDLGLAGTDKTYVDMIRAAFVETWGQDAREVMEATALFEAMARSCAERQSTGSPINQRFVACITGAAEHRRQWQRYLKAIQMIDALQHSTGSRGLPDHRFFVDIAGDWSF